MGIEIVIAIAALSVLVSMVSGGVSVATAFRFKKQSSDASEEHSKVTIKKKHVIEKFSPVANKEESDSFSDGDKSKTHKGGTLLSREIEEEELTFDENESRRIESLTTIARNGMPNEVASKLSDTAKDAAGLLSQGGGGGLAGILSGAASVFSSLKSDESGSDKPEAPKKQDKGSLTAVEQSEGAGAHANAEQHNHEIVGTLLGDSLDANMSVSHELAAA